MSAGFSKARLGRMHDVMAAHVERGGVPGLVTLVSRHGEVHVDAIGLARDTIFRIASMTKPVTAVATLILVEGPSTTRCPRTARSPCAIC